MYLKLPLKIKKSKCKRNTFLSIPESGVGKLHVVCGFVSLHRQPKVVLISNWSPRGVGMGWGGSD